MRLVVFLISIFIIGCAKVTFWTTGANEYGYSPPVTAEIQITDTSYAEYINNWGGCLSENSGSCTIYKSSYRGDTLLVFDLEGRPSPHDRGNYELTEVIIMAFLRKGRKLWPIYNHYPHLHQFTSEASEISNIDSTFVKTFSVNWKGWSRKNDNKAYINFGGDFDKKGKYKWLRNEIKNRRNSRDSIEWFTYFPKEYVNDSLYVYKTKTDYNGPLKNNGQ